MIKALLITMLFLNFISCKAMVGQESESKYIVDPPSKSHKSVIGLLEYSKLHEGEGITVCVAPGTRNYSSDSFFLEVQLAFAMWLHAAGYSSETWEKFSFKKEMNDCDTDQNNTFQIGLNHLEYRVGAETSSDYKRVELNTRYALRPLSTTKQKLKQANLEKMNFYDLVRWGNSLPSGPVNTYIAFTSILHEVGHQFGMGHSDRKEDYDGEQMNIYFGRAGGKPQNTVVFWDPYEFGKALTKNAVMYSANQRVKLTKDDISGVKAIRYFIKEYLTK